MKIATYLPEKITDNSHFDKLGWSADKIFAKTGIKQRHIAGKDEYALDMAENACNRLLTEHDIDKTGIDYLVYCTQSPDTLIPNNSSILQEKLGLPKNMGSFDFNQGCSGFVYGLSIAKGLLLTGQSAKLLLVTTETYTKHIADDDRTNRTIFGDAAAATLLTVEDAEKIGDFVFGTDGKGADNLCVKGLGVRKETDSGKTENLYMNGPEIFTFTLREVPNAVNKILKKTGMTMEEIDHFVFHQANGFILEHLRKKTAIPKEKFHTYLENVGNTVSSTIPIALEQLYGNDMIKKNQKIMLVAFGVGYSWAVTVLNT